MITVPELASEALSSFLASDMTRRFGTSHARLTELVPSYARLALECIGNSDALYHNVEHTMLVTLAGHDIMKGRALLIPRFPVTMPTSSLRASCTTSATFEACSKATDLTGTSSTRLVARQSCRANRLTLHFFPITSTGPRFVMDRLATSDVFHAARIARAIGSTRFPISAAEADDQENEDGSLVRAADLIGQLGDPQYLRKANALYHEFEEAGVNKQLGYTSPAALVDLYPRFYWNSAFPHIQPAIRYLQRHLERPAMGREPLWQRLSC
jgi:hypothetical protein